MANEEQQRVIEYLRTENQVAKEKIGKKRILLNDDQRRRLAVKGKLIGRKTLSRIATIVSPNSILRWKRKLVAAKWDYTNRRKLSGRARIPRKVRKLVLKFANKNPSWGYDRIQGALDNIGHTISDTSVRNILKANDIEPAPSRKGKTTWNTFLKAHWDVLATIDFTTVEVCTKSGLVMYYVLLVMDLRSRRVHFAGCTANPNDVWMKQIAGNLTAFDGFLIRCRCLLTDRDTKCCSSFREILPRQMSRVCGYRSDRQSEWAHGKVYEIN